MIRPINEKDAEEKSCPIDKNIDHCITKHCMAWRKTRSKYGYCILMK